MMTTKIVPVNFVDDLEKLSLDGNYYIGIEEMSITYTQPADTNSSSDDIQAIKLTSRTACSVTTKEALNKDGFYIDIEIPEGGHWSVDNEESLVAIIKDFTNKLYLNEI